MTKDARANRDEKVIEEFGMEWTKYDQTGADERDLEMQFDSYFSIFPWGSLKEGCVGYDLGCGSGRWDAYLAPRVGQLHCLEPSADALAVARKRLSGFSNVTLHQCGVEALPFPDSSMDFGVSLGVLHHVPDTGQGIRECARVLKRDAPFLVYLYYNFENRPAWFRALWWVSNLMRRGICRLPFRLKAAVTTLIATFVYYPLARGSAMLERIGVSKAVVDVIPLSSYRNWSFYWMRTDALDRFGTRLEKRFSREDIRRMMTDAGLVNISFKEGRPMWTALGYKAE